MRDTSIRKKRSVSLQHFANAKQSRYDKRQVQEHKNLLKLIRKKKVSKQLKKEMLNQTARQNDQDDQEAEIQSYHIREQDEQQNKRQGLQQTFGDGQQPADNDKHVSQKHKKHERQRRKSQVQRMYELQQKEKQTQLEQRQHYEKLKQEKQEELKQQSKKRQEDRKRHLKRNWKGQPIMSYQIEGILQKLEAERKTQK
eukprot:TRINITY_DN240_c0_g2_i1.p2 TRINITY_DN240_c0_g2~~TRINITY_DN240_c0_g2_i1.p2  ORF type:complete len:198 (-),score=24.60 TRINITY_DN240_c0_g2_i1:241-834(-)